MILNLLSTINLRIQNNRNINYLSFIAKLIIIVICIFSYGALQKAFSGWLSQRRFNTAFQRIKKYNYSTLCPPYKKPPKNLDGFTNIRLFYRLNDNIYYRLNTQTFKLIKHSNLSLLYPQILLYIFQAAAFGFGQYPPGKY